ncbi:magnesium transporter [Evansella cellulosilytica]|uniref:Magnesium transporter MgtE n=1 Tax=Evansella cellulosilytica (strain ATCC 21833 / DSM 2522 / FERM P-1141 / JCM 9156 / N-4) TaxID=649639 RepID=E6TQW4_EVAC2|nr:magnesium transporter [Evansella cellulosilytica]ADU31739.1 magnesium transporter [Evansella cellulosilytica DSM 2522]
MTRLNDEAREKYFNNIFHALKVKNKEKFLEYFLELHPTDQVELFQDLYKDKRPMFYEYLSATEFAEIFQGLELEEQKEVILELDKNYAAEMFNYMQSDDIADFLGEINEPHAKDILAAMDKEEADEVIELLSYPDESAGALMTKEFIAIKATDTAAKVMDFLRSQGPEAETIYYLYVVDMKDKLVGVVSLRDLIISPLTETVENLMSSQVVSVEAHTDQEEVAKMIKDYDLLAAPVVTTTNELIGIVTVDDVMDVIEEEAEEDFGEFTAAKGATDVNISSFSAAKKRSPWIIMLMFFGLITAGVIGTFEETLEEIVLLAVFIPLIMDSAGNTGTQSLAVMVRSLATGSFERKGLLHTVKREFGTGVMLGIICAVVLMIVVPFLYGSYLLAFIVGVSLFLTLSVATIIGAVVPVIITKLKLDPAIASGPFITTVNDILGLLIYFTIATALLDYLPK